jgi:hypothetical protein
MRVLRLERVDGLCHVSQCATGNFSSHSGDFGGNLAGLPTFLMLRHTDSFAL